MLEIFTNILLMTKLKTKFLRILPQQAASKKAEGLFAIYSNSVPTGHGWLSSCVLPKIRCSKIFFPEL